MISAAVIEALKEIVPADKVLLQEPMKLHTTFRIGGPGRLPGLSGKRRAAL